MTFADRAKLLVLGRNYWVHRDGRVFNEDGTPKAATPQSNGYSIVNFTGEGKRKAVRLHVLVAEAFHGARPNGCVVRHLDGVPQNNCADNLAWGTQADNMSDSKKHGTLVFGSRIKQSKLSEIGAAAVRRLRDLVTQPVLARAFGVTQDVISKAQRHETWARADFELTLEQALQATFYPEQRARLFSAFLAGSEPLALETLRHGTARNASARGRDPLASAEPKNDIRRPFPKRKADA